MNAAVGAVSAVDNARRAAAPPAPGPTGDPGAFADALRRATPAGSPIPGITAGPPTGVAGRTVLDTALLGLGRSAGPGDGSAHAAAVFRQLGVELPSSLEAQATMGAPVDGLGAARSGDLVVLGEPPSHVGIYAGRGRVVVAPVEGGPVQLQDLSGPIATIRRIVTDPTPAWPAAAALSLGSAAPAGTVPGAAAPGPAATSTAAWDDVPHRELFERAGSAHGIDPAVLAAVARVESGFDPTAVSRAGAQGLMQFMPATAAGLGVDPWDPASAIDGAARYLRSGLDRFGSLELALAAYNAGPGAVQRHGGVPPFPETQSYVRKVLDAREQYRR